jgi:hypothetical protein
VDDELLLLAKVNVPWPTVSPLGGVDVRPPNLGVRTGLIASDSKPKLLRRDLIITHRSGVYAAHPLLQDAIKE